MSTTLTAPATACKNASHAGQILTFAVGRETYGIPVAKVRKITQCVAITRVPHMPPYIKGVMNLSGKIMVVVDLHARFGMEETQMSERSCIVVVQVTLKSKKEVLLGLIVDSVEGVLHATEVDIEETPEFGTAIDTSYLNGLVKIEGKVVMLLDIDRVLEDVKLPAAEEAGL